ncbi:MAG: helix-turn-helix domain-containing protein, partial [Planctomycetota bacterium]
MSNLIPLEDAAKMLGLTVDKLNEMRSSSEIFGYKDGTSWKFKMQEIERVADELGVTVGSADAVEDDEFDISLEDDDLDFDLGDSSVDLIQEDSVESQDNDEDDGD